jgi:N-acetyl-alpha-D-muramate 1-phosphate uridylyltransferase
MKAMIFAAGLGTRLAPFTSHAPKALVPLGGKPMLQRVAEKLIGAGAGTIVVNVHHHAEKIVDFLERLEHPGVRFIVSDESDRLLDTGGGLKKAAPHLAGGGPIILHNADVLSDIDLGGMVRHHLSSGAIATLAVTRRESTRYFLWDGSGRLGGWENRTTGERILCGMHHDPVSEPSAALEPLAFSGIHIVDPALFTHLQERDVFSINQVYLQLAAAHPVIHYLHDHRYWADLGTPEKLRLAEKLYEREQVRFNNTKP